ncbi:unnamed protein product, partial [Vitis vinifera]
MDLLYHERTPRGSEFSLESFDLHEGDWGNVGSVIEWSYVIDRKNHIAKDIVKVIAKENKSYF